MDAQITEDYVSFEVAKLLKEKGFDEYCSHFYRVDGEHEYCCKAKLPRLANSDIRNHDDWVNRVFACTCPTLQMAMKWLRDVHNIFVKINYTIHPINKDKNYYGSVINMEDLNETVLVFEDALTYEDCANRLLKDTLDNLDKYKETTHEL